MVSRRDFLKISAAAGAGAVLATKFRGLEKTLAYPLMAGLSDPALQPKFLNYAPNALAPGFIYRSRNNKYRITVRQTAQMKRYIKYNELWGYFNPK